MLRGSHRINCPGCRAEIVLPEDHAALLIPCPNCARKVAMRTVVDFPGASRTRSRNVWIVAGGLVALGLGVLGYRYHGHLASAFGFLADATGGRMIAVLSLALALLVLVCLFFWMIFPLLVYLGLKDLRRRITRLDQTTQLCAGHLAQLTTEPDVPQPEPQPEPKTPGAAPS